MSDGNPPLQDVFAFESARGVLVITPKVDLDSLQVDIERGLSDVLDEIHRSGMKHVLLDFTNAGYFGTTMLGAMVRLWKRISLEQGRMALCNVSEPVHEVLRFTKLSTLWPIYPNREEALAAIGE